MYVYAGLMTGCFVALFLGYCIMAHIAGMYTQRRDSIYMETVYPVFRYTHVDSAFSEILR